MSRNSAKKPTKANTKQQKPDWEAIEGQYRAGILSIRTLASHFGITEGAIRKKAKAEGWQRDLADKVRKAAKEKLVRSDGTQEGTHSRTKDKEIIESAAELIVTVERTHRKSIGKGRNLVLKLIEELDDVSENREEIEESIRDLTKEDKDDKRLSRMLKATSLAVRSGVMLNLSAAMKNVIALERASFNMDESGGADELGIEKVVLASIARRDARRAAA